MMPAFDAFGAAMDELVLRADNIAASLLLDD